MIKYKEIPIDDSKGVEQFKVGDMVRIYSRPGWPIERVKEIRDKIVLAGSIWRDWRCLRKLEEFKPKDFWIKAIGKDCDGNSLNIINDVNRWVTTTVQTVSLSENTRKSEYVHVREVTDD